MSVQESVSDEEFCLINVMTEPSTSSPNIRGSCEISGCTAELQLPVGTKVE